MLKSALYDCRQFISFLPTFLLLIMPSFLLYFSFNLSLVFSFFHSFVLFYFYLSFLYPFIHSFPSIHIFILPLYRLPHVGSRGCWSLSQHLRLRQGNNLERWPVHHILPFLDHFLRVCNLSWDLCVFVLVQQ